MDVTIKVVVFLISLVMVPSSVGIAGSQPGPASQPVAGRGTHDSSVADSRRANPPTPPYPKSAKEARPFPPLLPASRFAKFPVIARAYQIASEIPGVLAQQPCYCNCDTHFGHTSLLDCYASDHTAGCGICIKETFFTFQLTQQRKSPSEIRKAIIRGDWQKVDIQPPSH